MKKNLYVKIKSLQETEIIRIGGGAQCRCYNLNGETDLWNGVNKLQSCINICCKNSDDCTYKFINQEEIYGDVCPKKDNHICQNHIDATNNLQIIGSKIYIINSQTIFASRGYFKNTFDF